MIAYYLQSPRADALDRARALIDGIGAPVTLVSSRPAPFSWRGGWDNLGDVSSGALAAWLVAHEVDAVVVDGAAEYVEVVRAAGIRTIEVARPGAHPDASLADLVLAPWADDAAESDPDRVVQLGAPGAASARALAARPPRPPSSGRGPSRCVSITPTASGPGPRERREILSATPTWHWWFAGERDLLDDGPVWDRLLRADVLVCAPTGPNLAAAAATQVPTILVLPARPSDEETFLAEAARRTAPVIVTGEPGALQWRSLLAYAHGLDGRGWAGWSPRPGLLRLAALLDGTSTEPHPPLQEGDDHDERRRTDEVRRPLLDV